MACTWITSEEVREALGRPTETGETAWGGYVLEVATQAANDFAFDQRAAEGITDDAVVCPSARVRLGTVMYAVRVFQQSASNSDVSTIGFDGGGALPSMGAIRANLGLRRFRVDGTAVSTYG